jgi:hypothetical protein
MVNHLHKNVKPQFLEFFLIILIIINEVVSEELGTFHFAGDSDLSAQTILPSPPSHRRLRGLSVHSLRTFQLRQRLTHLKHPRLPSIIHNLHCP